MRDDHLTTADHLAAARRRGRGLIADEGPGRWSQELLHAVTAARDALIVLLLLWTILAAAGMTDGRPVILLTVAVAFALYTGIASGLAVAEQLRHWENELRRERDEIRNHPDAEREEVRAIYEAKGFSGETLDRIVDTLCADEDRLLKVMLEEELGIFFEQQHHPVIVGLVTAAGALIGGMSIALPGAWNAGAAVPVAGAVMLLVLAVVHGGRSWRDVVERLAAWVLTTATVCGVAWFLFRLMETGGT